MNLDSSLAFFINQGPIFWAATAAVGVGGALLITSVFIAMRRVISAVALRPRISLPKIRRKISETPTAARPSIQVTEAGYGLAGAAPVDAAPADSTVNSELNALLQRLQAAGNRLEETIQGASGTGRPYSPLKAPVAMVEQETRVGVG